MYYVPFHERFPEVAKQETRTVFIYNDPDVPADEYILIDAYCNEPGCDCRRVFFNVYSQRKKELVAVIAYGWESRPFYAEWFGDDDPEVIKEMQGPILNLGSRQAEFAPALLKHITMVLEDSNYHKRIERHYQMFKDSVNQEDAESNPEPWQRSTQKVGRNAPCPCGSGRKYKRCCGKPSRR